MTYRKDLETADPKKPLVLTAVNCGIEALGEDVEKAYLDFEHVPEEGDSSSAQEPLQITDAESLSIEVRGEWESKITGRIRLHLPQAEEWSVSVKTNNGRIVFRGLRGTLQASTNNGRTRLEEVKGALTASCANGSVESHRFEGQADVSASNGRIDFREAVLRGGSFKSGNGRIVLQFKPQGSGDLSVFSGNGRVKLALPDDGDFTVRVQTRGRLFNHLEDYALETDKDTTTIRKGGGDFSVVVQNYNGGVSLVKYEDVDKAFRDRSGRMDFGEDFDPMEFARRFCGSFDPQDFARHWSREFADEVPHIMRKMARFGSRFGRMGEEISRQFHEGRGRGGGEEIKMILDMLGEGKISAEEAEKLINAIKAKQGGG